MHPHLIHGFLGSHEYASKWDHDRYNHFIRTYWHAKHSYRQTDHGTRCVFSMGHVYEMYVVFHVDMKALKKSEGKFGIDGSPRGDNLFVWVSLGCNHFFLWVLKCFMLVIVTLMKEQTYCQIASIWIHWTVPSVAYCNKLVYCPHIWDVFWQSAENDSLWYDWFH